MRNIEIQPNHIYHIYNRGVNKQPIFFAAADWEIFLNKMRNYFQRENVRILSYCLMPNHYHFLVQVLCENFGNLVMHPFSTSFTKTINLRNDRVGPLFQGRFQAKEINNDETLLHVSRYIHMNPVVAGLVESPEDWKYSSYLDFLGKKDGISAISEILDYFANIAEFLAFTKDSQTFLMDLSYLPE